MITLLVLAALIAGMIALVCHIGWAALIPASVWVLGAVAADRLMAMAGARNPQTIGDSFSGDDDIDGVLVMCWPLSLPAWAVWVLVGRCARLRVR